MVTKLILQEVYLTKFSRVEDILQVCKSISHPERIVHKMGNARREVKTSRYTIHIKGHLDSHWEDWFDGMKITYTDTGMTILSGEVIDQSALHGLLEKVHSLNLTLLSVRKIDPDDENFQR